MLQKIILGVIFLNIIVAIVLFSLNSYPWLVIAPHVLSLIFIIGFAYKSIFPKKHKMWMEILAVAILFISSFWVRVYLLDVVTPGIQGDEVIVAYSARELPTTRFIPFIASNFGHPTLIPYFVRMSTAFFGDTIFGIRFPNVLLGSLVVAVFYLLLRLFFNRRIAFLGSFLFAFSYPAIALSRVIYEPTISFLFQILSMYFIVVAVRKRQLIFYAASGIFLGLCNYGYVNSRGFVIAALMVIILCVCMERLNLVRKIRMIGITLIFTFISSLPFIHYFLIHPDQFFLRIQVLSLFNQGLSMRDVFLNILGGIGQLRLIFLYPGDPNLRINPGGAAFIDILTLGLIVLGVIYMIRKRRRLLFSLLFLCTPFLISDILAYESGPANTFFGFAHPNTLRISGILPLLLIIASFGISRIDAFLKNVSLSEDSQLNRNMIRGFVLGVLILVFLFMNWLAYFKQTPSPYTYTVNGVAALEAVRLINTSQSQTFAVTKYLYDDIRFQYFISKKKNVRVFKSTNVANAIQQINSTDVTFIDSEYDLETIKGLVESDKIKKQLTTHQVFGATDLLIYY